MNSCWVALVYITLTHQILVFYYPFLFISSAMWSQPCDALPSLSLLQLWTVDEGYTFDNVYVGQDAEEAVRLRKELWEPRYKVEVRARSIV